MLSLIYKDLMLCKRSLPMVLLYGFLMIFIFDSRMGLGSAGFVATTVAVVYLLVGRAAAYDDIDKAEVMLLSLPIARAQIVAAKYLSVIVFTVLGVLAYVVCSLFYRLLALPIQAAPITVEVLVGALIGVTLFAAVFFPVYFKVGFVKSRFFTMFLFLLAFFLPTLVLSALQSGKIAWLNQAMGVLQAQPESVIIAMSLVGCLALLAVSVLVSLWIYNRREF